MARIAPTLVPASHPLERLPEEWAATLAEAGEPRFRGGQVFRWLHQRGVCDPQGMSDLPRSLRARLEALELSLPVSVDRAERAEDGTEKLALRLADGNAIETVLLPEHAEESAPDDEPDEGADGEPGVGPALGREGVPGSRRVSQCVSTQVGCAMGCVFCASGVAGLTRHLTAAEIVGQVLLGRARVEAPSRLTNVVLMGMGEPLHNYDAVARALVLLTHPEGLGLSTRRVTVSTSGLVPEIDRLGREFGGQVQLAVSLHATRDEQRSAVMPVNRRYPIAELVASLERYPLPRRRRITIEYTLLAGTNDTLADADALVRVLARVPIKVNLIPMNPVASSDLAAPAWEQVEAFQARLRARGVAAFVRRRRGERIAAACGQLALEGAAPRRARRVS